MIRMYPPIRALLIVIACLSACGRSPAPPPAPVGPSDDSTVVFVNVHVVRMDREAIDKHQTVIVRDGTIVRVADAADVPVPPGATRIDGAGKYLMPGLAEMHGHYPPWDKAKEFTETVLFLYVANGITLVRGMQGDEQHLALRDAIERGEVIGPRLLVSSPPMSGNNVTSPDQARALVQQYKQAGFDHIKVHENLSVDVYDALAAAARDAELRFAGHVSNFVGLRHALAAGQDTIDHLDNYVEALVTDPSLVKTPGLLTPAKLVEQADESRIPALVQATIDAGAGVVPTMVLWETFFSDTPSAELHARSAGMAYVPKKLTDRWAKAVDGIRGQAGDPAVGKRVLALRRAVLRALNEGGATILFGTDSPQLFSVPGFSIHREMQVMVECGMTPYQVLRSGTAAVAAFYGAERAYGQVAEGMRADLLLVDANPLEDVAHVARRSGVMVNGRWLSRDDIDRRLAEIASGYRD